MLTRSLSRTVRGVRAFAGVPSAIPSITLEDGHKHPLLGYGTYKARRIPRARIPRARAPRAEREHPRVDGAARAQVGYVPPSASSAAAGAEAAGATADASAEPCVRDALAEGYRFIDCAEFYANEAEVGAAVADAAGTGVARAELFLASKVWTTNIHAGESAVRAQVEKTLRELRTDYLDLYCVHWPVPGKHVAAYRALERLHDEGVIRSLGVSNYTVEDYSELAAACNVQPQVNQIEVNPFLYRRETLAFFAAEGVAIQSYRTLRDGKAFADPLLVGLGAKHGKSPAQVLARWCTQKGVVAIAKSMKRERMRENAAIFDFELDAEDMAKLDALTTPESLQTFQELYRKCVVRDTPLAGTTEGVKMDITLH